MTLYLSLIANIVLSATVLILFLKGKAMSQSLDTLTATVGRVEAAFAAQSATIAAGSNDAELDALNARLTALAPLPVVEADPAADTAA